MYPDSNQQLNYESGGEVYFFIHAFDPLNNWSAHQVTLWGETFPTVEHAYHYRKFSDDHPKIAEKILGSLSPWAAMQVERKNKSKVRSDWQKVKVSIMAEITKAKFNQNKDARDCLLNTGNKTIIENSPWDNFWGIGASGKGQNKMGQILMQVRTELAEHR